MLHHHTRTLLSTAVTASLLAAPALAATGDEQQGLKEVKPFSLTHNAQLIDKASELLDAVETYAEVIAAHDGYYAGAWQAEGSTLAATIQEIREVWLDTSNEYEAIEGIVAGIPETAKYDLILDAGNQGSADEDVAEYDLTLPGGSVLERPGNLFHGITEPMFWGTDPEHVMLDADLDGNGTVTRGEVLFDANLALGATQAILYWSRELEQDMSAWVPNRDDAFTAVVTMTPTVGDYFGEWKESQFIDADFATAREARTAAAIAPVRAALTDYAPVALSDAERLRRARLLRRFLDLVGIEYQDGVRNGELSIPMECHEAVLTTAKA